MIMNANMNSLDRVGITFEASGLQFSFTVRLLACFLEFARLITRTALYSNAFGDLITASTKSMALKLCILNIRYCSFSTLVGPRAAFLVGSLDGLFSITWDEPLNNWQQDVHATTNIRSVLIEYICPNFNFRSQTAVLSKGQQGQGN